MEEAEGRQRKIIVDIDNILWHLAPELWEALKKVNPEMPLAEWEFRRVIGLFKKGILVLKHLTKSSWDRHSILRLIHLAISTKV